MFRLGHVSEPLPSHEQFNRDVVHPVREKPGRLGSSSAGLTTMARSIWLENSRSACTPSSTRS